MLKKIMIVALLATGIAAVDTAEANAWVVRRRIAPVRRIAARAVLPPYPVARRTVVRRPVVYGRPVYAFSVYRAPVYGPRVSVGIGVGSYYGW